MTTNRRLEAPALAEAFERLVRRHRSEIFRTVFRFTRNREDAEDLTQITFMNAYTALQRGAQPDVPRAWLHAIARNAGSRRYRQQRIVEVELEDELRGPLEEDVPTVGELQAALAQLTLNQRAALLMREVGGLSAREIAVRLGISPGAVATLLFRARRALRVELEGEGRPLLGGLASLATVVRAAWLRLLAPAGNAGELLTRSGTAAGVAAAATGVALLTTSAVPLPARADHARAVRVAAAAVTGQVVHVRRAPVVHVALPARVQGRTHVASVVRSAHAHHAASTSSAPVARAHASAPPASTTHPAPAEQSASVSDHADAPAPASTPSTPAAPAAEAQPAPVAAAPTAPQPVAAAQSLVSTATRSVPPTGAVTSAVPSAPSTSLPQAPAPPPVEVPPVTPPPVTPTPLPVEPPALPPPPPTGILPTG